MAMMKKAVAKKPMTKTVTKTTVKKSLTGPAAVKAMQDRVSPAGVKKAEAGAKKAIDKKYPGLYKKKK
jgi:formaldehyde-activating enzyme involved in methanogenesis